MATSRRWRGEELAPPARELAEEYDVESFHAEVLDEILAEVWGGRTELGFQATLARSVHANVAAIFDILRGRLALQRAHPQPALDFADLCAQLGVPEAEIERAYRVGVARLWASWSLRSAERVSETPDGAQLLLVGPSLTMMSYIDHVLDAVIGRYESTRTELTASKGQLRRLLVLQLLDGTLPDAGPETDARLGYPLGDEHVAILLYTAEHAPDESLLAALREAAAARGTLVHQHGPRAWIVWLGSAFAYGRDELSRLSHVLDESGLIAAVSEPARGLDGWRRTHEQVSETAHIQRTMGTASRRVLLAGDVRLETLLLDNEERARSFVRAELGPLAAEDPAFARLRETVLVWLSSGSHVNAAAMLGVHENTIRNRIRQAEKLLDDALVNRRTELQVALRLERVLQAGPPTDRYR